MIKALVLILGLAVLASSVSHGQFIVNRDICRNSFLTSCQFLPLNQGQPL